MRPYIGKQSLPSGSTVFTTYRALNLVCNQSVHSAKCPYKAHSFISTGITLQKKIDFDIY